MTAAHGLEPDRPVAVIVEHRAKPGRRDDLVAVWDRLMGPAVTANDGHLAYHYTVPTDDPDAVVAFQLYRSATAAAEFLTTPAYGTYVAESADLLATEPRVRTASVHWSKPT